MYFVEEGTQRCGLYGCTKCASRFLDARIVPRMVCPYCGVTMQDLEIGPDDVMPSEEENAVLEEVIEGAENVALHDGLLSLALTGGNYEWI